jgi:hypothetical protein
MFRRRALDFPSAVRLKGLPLKEFFLVLSTVGKAYRRCQLAWVNGDQVGVSFIKSADKKKKSQQPMP